MNLTAPLTDKDNALECLAACQQVYLTATIETDECHVLIIQKPECIIVAFRGSKSAADWINDAEFPMLTIAGGKVHEGFWYSYSTITVKLQKALAMMPRLPIIVTGHSLGGAHATIFAYNFEAEFDIRAVVTFGSPRVGNGQFADSYNSGLRDITLRYVDARDIVPRVPFRDMGYVHVGQEGFLTTAGALELNPTVWEMFHDDVIGAVEDIRAGHIELLDDHHPERYQARILAL